MKGSRFGLWALVLAMAGTWVQTQSTRIFYGHHQAAEGDLDLDL
jgi:hypothetical protein